MIIRSGRKWSSTSEERNDPGGVLPVRGRTRSIRILNRCRARMFAPEKLSPRKLFILRPCLSARSRIKKKKKREREKGKKEAPSLLDRVAPNVRQRAPSNVTLRNGERSELSRKKDLLEFYLSIMLFYSQS